MAELTDQRLPEAVRLVVGGVPFEEAIAQTLVNPDRLGDALLVDRNALLSEIDRLRERQSKLEAVAEAARELATWIVMNSLESHAERIGELYEHTDAVEAALAALGEPSHAH
jgi:hypothetical protein